MTDTIIRVASRSDTPYFLMSRATAQDKRLSAEARGVLTYLLSKPDKWQVRIADLQTEFGVGRDKVYRILKELIQARYITRNKHRSDSGAWVWEPYYVYESPYPENPDTVNTEIIDSTDDKIIQNNQSRNIIEQRLKRVARTKRARAKQYDKWHNMNADQLADELRMWQAMARKYPTRQFISDALLYLEQLTSAVRSVSESTCAC